MDSSWYQTQIRLYVSNVNEGQTFVLLLRGGGGGGVS